MTDLDKLIAAVEAGTAIAGDFRKVWPGYAGSTTVEVQNSARSYDGDMNAALRLHEALLPGWFPGMSQNINHGHWYAWVQDENQVHFTSTQPTPARAWLLAILRALKAKGDA